MCCSIVIHSNLRTLICSNNHDSVNVKLSVKSFACPNLMISLLYLAIDLEFIRFLSSQVIMMNQELVDREWNANKNIATCVALTYVCADYLISAVDCHSINRQHYWVTLYYLKKFLHTLYINYLLCHLHNIVVCVSS